MSLSDEIDESIKGLTVRRGMSVPNAQDGR